MPIIVSIETDEALPELCARHEHALPSALPMAMIFSSEKSAFCLVCPGAVPPAQVLERDEQNLELKDHMRQLMELVESMEDIGRPEEAAQVRKLLYSCVTENEHSIEIMLPCQDDLTTWQVRRQLDMPCCNTDAIVAGRA